MSGKAVVLATLLSAFALGSVPARAQDDAPNNPQPNINWQEAWGAFASGYAQNTGAGITGSVGGVFGGAAGMWTNILDQLKRQQQQPAAQNTPATQQTPEGSASQQVLPAAADQGNAYDASVQASPAAQALAERTGRSDSTATPCPVCEQAGAAVPGATGSLAPHEVTKDDVPQNMLSQWTGQYQKPAAPFNSFLLADAYNKNVTVAEASARLTQDMAPGRSSLSAAAERGSYAAEQSAGGSDTSAVPLPGAQATNSGLSRTLHYLATTVTDGLAGALAMLERGYKDGAGWSQGAAYDGGNSAPRNALQVAYVPDTLGDRHLVLTGKCEGGNRC